MKLNQNVNYQFVRTLLKSKTIVTVQDCLNMFDTLGISYVTYTRNNTVKYRFFDPNFVNRYYYTDTRSGLCRVRRYSYYKSAIDGRKCSSNYSTILNSRKTETVTTQHYTRKTRVSLNEYCETNQMLIILSRMIAHRHKNTI